MVEYTALKDGIFSPNSVDYNSLMRRRIKKANNPLQPIFEAFSNSLEATSGKHNSIHIELHLKIKTYLEINTLSQLLALLMTVRDLHQQAFYVLKNYMTNQKIKII